MAKYILDIDLWTTVDAKSEEEALVIGQWLINQLATYAESIDISIQAQVKDGGLEELEEAAN